MRARQAKKIMRQQAENATSKHKTSRYWFKRWVDFEYFCVGMGHKCDHRIVRAINKTFKLHRK